MVHLVPAVPVEVLRQELSDTTRISRFKNLEIHMVWAAEAPSVMEEIGRIRELEYRAEGAGRNVASDVDAFDTGWPGYVQVVSFDREEGEIVAMYRAMHCGWALRHGGLEALRTHSLFSFSDEFVSRQLPQTVELGRSVVNRRARRAVQGLFSVWTGLGALLCEWSETQGFFGNVSVYEDLSNEHLAVLWRYLEAHHYDTARRVRARPEASVVPGLPGRPPSRGAGGGGGTDAGDKAAAGRKTAAGDQTGAGDEMGIPRTLEELGERAKREGFRIPRILVSYLKAAPGLVAFDIAADADFGGAREIAIYVPVDGLGAKTRRRIIEPYISENPSRFVLPESPWG
ncbi:MAG: GNAT family N-acyltransferase [Spirochaetota bacterium]